MALVKDGVTMYQKPNNGDNADENRTSEIRGTEGENRSIFNSNGCGLPGQDKGKSKPQSKRTFRTDSENRDGVSFRRQTSDRQTILEFVKKLTRRLELLEQKHTKYVADHRRRLIARLNENEEFALEVQPEIQSLKEDMAELIRVLGASEDLKTTETATE
ncbi:hypothetical protein [Okeania sp. SIO1I7]|uniref:hypothetical protein n=1 Tax=Okeania sp. SIO1I7 TaxID=2607772 RepID=UPI0013FBD7EA|nr:hypothetical protein [Okeania sp. SIO1I7]NET29511.1 hypothetical protein [Okeania sp. SIO1I7]